MDEHLKALQDTLQHAADNKSTAHIGPKEAAEGAKAIQRVVDEAFDKDAQSNAADWRDWNEKLFQPVPGMRDMQGNPYVYKDAQSNANEFDAHVINGPIAHKVVDSSDEEALQRFADWARQSGPNMYDGNLTFIPAGTKVDEEVDVVGSPIGDSLYFTAPTSVTVSVPGNPDVEFKPGDEMELEMLDNHGNFRIVIKDKETG